jgi:hypothetical protein
MPEAATVAGQSLEAAHLAGRGSRAVEAVAIHHNTHRRIVGKTIGIVDILVAGETAKYRLTEQPRQQMPGVLAPATFRERRPCQIGQPEGVLKLR